MSVVLHILLTILKIIGIVLLSIIGLILFLVIFILAAPISYDVCGAYCDDIKAKGKIYWLYHIVKVCINFKEKELQLKISLFGLQVYPRKKKKKEESLDYEAATQSAASVSEDKPEESSASEIEMDETESTVGDQEEKTEEAEEVSVSEESEESASEDTSQETEEQMSEDSSNTDSEPESETSDTDTSEAELSETVAVSEGEGSDDDLDDGLEEDKDADAEDEGGAKALIKRGWEFLQEPSVKKLIGKLFKGIKKILKHLLPKRLDIEARIGMDDPSTTGQIMEVAAILYAIYGEHIRVTGDFEEKVMKGKVSLKGRIIPGYLVLVVLGMGLRVLLNKECRTLYKEIRKAKS